MTDYLVFTLVAPMGSFGDAPGNERRGSSFRWPGRSAILGLLGAADGIRRDDRDGQESLNDFQMAVSVLMQGNLILDYHTVQTVPRSKGKKGACHTRKEALEMFPTETIVTKRDYHTDCAFGVAVWGAADLNRWVDRLNEPVFVPCLGRKSCPLSAPMSPQIVCEDDPLSALAKVRLPCFIEVDPSRPVLVASDVDTSDVHADGPVRIETRWDHPLDRTLWHFAKRQAYISHPAERTE